ncbi:MAG: reactive intermediate/imine deaminase [SAR86 cluster bacterium BACL1 MAG-121105-bin34]|jgi:2-iminobutanoate/2-iminopropanoate deaminase|uniref:Reactive intermediate/imine deaminase n=2 Tax=SAR86 cluster TaxID=62672 RepID=A0A0R2UA62_9GAMM|nr:MAG: reactive intermediate/imine deaminase [SAR86 cluster bacterium BACL1 MAG-120507-bin14]KRO40347.1 MAG: reactive intermediate/imine deaminase [SAR86 cluster bacterium BACL1 MAG-120920-bin57]KRO96373.1 MAG: reactive intermediate/imine deaminase [SAR86 cluster bacterium BACL1 MAG-120820-bin45]KRO97664.1 MAG: reactive intermediate/imine deaminase [SAR86 cluster bacterium BACL1 MAG-120828-bin5]KRO99545.1 MAG: reactive intermediate/imine deaminase [SAR86 cluster bacterium BACL1 MAG-120823-bin8|tara:strand:- start:488 stop:871 length:384 start_codon:yes stop_codon:yes gene_type:complete
MKKPIFTNKAPAAIGPYSQAVQWGDVVFISGQIPLIPETGTLNNATFEDETNQVLDNLEAICKEAGGNLDNILKLTIYLTDLSRFDMVNTIMASRFSEPFPARATVEISKLPKEVNIEIDAILSIAV